MNKSEIRDLDHQAVVSGKLFEELEFRGTNDQNPVSFKNQLTAIYQFVSTNEFTRTLEVGLGIGGSAVHILKATQKKHVAMDPVQLVSYNNLGLENVKRCGFGESLEFYNESSEFVLPQLMEDGRKFDFIYIDGDHKFDYALIDFTFSDPILEVNGFILLDDAWMPSIKRLDKYLMANRSNYEYCEPLYKESILLKKIRHRPNDDKFRNF